MRRFLPVLMVCLAVGLPAQQPIDPSTWGAVAPSVLAELARPPKGNTLPCELEHYRPFFSFALRFQAGYRAWIPLKSYEGEAVDLHVVFRVTPVRPSGAPVYFGETFRLPAAPPQRNLYYAVNGGFFLGPGEYRVEWLLMDNRGRSHRRDWTIKTGKPPKDAESALAPGAVDRLAIDAWGEISRAMTPGATLPLRALLLIHATSIRPRAIELSYGDQVYLLFTLAALLREAPFEEISVIAFNLKQQQELLHAPRLNQHSFADLLDRLAKLALGTVDVSVLRRPKGHIDLLGRILNRELASENPPDAVIFIGPSSDDDDRIPAGLVEADSTRLPPVFYLRYRPYYAYFRYLPANDVISRLVKQLKGKTFDIFTPQELAGSVKDLTEMLRRQPELSEPSAGDTAARPAFVSATAP